MNDRRLRHTATAARISRLILRQLLLAALLSRIFACGPWFPDTMLTGGDDTLLAPPVNDFLVELNRIRGPVTHFQAVPATNGLARATCDTDCTELQAALAKSNLPSEEQDRIVGAFRAGREQLRGHAAALEQWRERELFRMRDEQPEPHPEFSAPAVPTGVPAEFADYFAGSVAFYAGDTNAAQAAWLRLLDRPRQDRHCRSTWAAFMIGKALLTQSPQQAALAFQLVRELAQAGLADSLGLAASSYGWEAQAELGQGHFTKAIELYLEQHQTGDATALQSLRVTARKLLDEPVDELERVAAVPFAQQVVTAYIVSRHSLTDIASAEETTRLVQAWLDAVERGGSGTVPGADRLALAAYQRGLFELADRWLSRASSASAVGQWVRAKLLLRAGQVARAAKVLSGVVRLFEREGDWPSPPAHTSIQQSDWQGWDDESPIRQSMGELGVLHLTRREYYQAVDVLVRSGFWSDGAYIAEYVLTLDELMAYVERQWPAPEESGANAGADGREYADAGRPRPESIALELRYLTGRRLARLQRWDEALEFYPPKWKIQLQQFVTALHNGRDLSRPASARAEALWEAAQIAREDGMELFGTEVEPDWHLMDGQFEWEAVSGLRGKSLPAEPQQATPDAPAVRSIPLRLSGSSPDEQRRIAAHKVDPDLRFHYRYLAADLGWEAAQLMPDNNEETARVLWRAGTWLKVRDPKTADRFYKSLVRRCGNTPLGQAADRLRWFPKTEQPEAVPAPEPAPEQATSEAAEPAQPQDASASTDQPTGQEEQAPSPEAVESQ